MFLIVSSGYRKVTERKTKWIDKIRACSKKEVDCNDLGIFSGVQVLLTVPSKWDVGAQKSYLFETTFIY